MTTITSKSRRSGKSILERFRGGPWPFILPGILLYAAFSLYPIIYLFYVSFTDMQIITIYQANWIGLDNYYFLYIDPIFRDVFIFTMVFVLITVPAQFTLGFGLALLLDQKLRGRVFFRMSIIIPMTIAAIVVGLMWRLMLHENQVGVVNAMLVSLGFNAVSWFSDPQLARLSIILVNLWQAVGFTMIFMLGGLQTLSQEVLEAAKVDGTSTWQNIIYIKLPMLKQISGLAIIFIFVQSFQIFEKILALTNGGPGRSTSTIGFRMYQTAFGAEESVGLLGRGSAIGVVMFLFTLFFTMIYMRMIDLDSEQG